RSVADDPPFLVPRRGDDGGERAIPGRIPGQECAVLTSGVVVREDHDGRSLAMVCPRLASHDDRRERKRDRPHQRPDRTDMASALSITKRRYGLRKFRSVMSRACAVAPDNESNITELSRCFFSALRKAPDRRRSFLTSFFPPRTDLWIWRIFTAVSLRDRLFITRDRGFRILGETSWIDADWMVVRISFSTQATLSRPFAALALARPAHALHEGRR